MKKVNLIGKRFGRLIVIAKSEKIDNRHNQYWVCKCDCGNYKEIRGHHLGKSINSCSCLHHLPKGESSFNQLFLSYKCGAKKRNLDFRLAKTEFYKLTQLPCFYCREQPAQIISKPRFNGVFIYNGIDRLDNTKGYITENCVSCCSVCNRMKMALSYEQFCHQIRKIYNVVTAVVD